MASIHKKVNSKYWQCAYYLPDGRRVLRSTKTTDRRAATAICEQLSSASKMAAEGRLTDTMARKAISEIYEIGNNSELPSSTIADFCNEWLLIKQLEVSDKTFEIYSGIIKKLITNLGNKSNLPMDSINVRDIQLFRAYLAKNLAGSTVNRTLTVLRSVFDQALKDGIVRENIMIRIDKVKTAASKRRAFTIEELQRVLEVCDDEWRLITLVGFYTGQRLGDIVGLTWENVDLQHEEIRLTTQKTGRSMILPIPPPLLNLLMTLPAPDNPQVVIFPTASSKSIPALSRSFRTILSSVGLASPPARHRANGNGRQAKREVSELSFHSLRHTTTSALKNGGVSNAIAMEIIGHESEAVSRAYTHIGTKTLKKAVDSLPDLVSV